MKKFPFILCFQRATDWPSLITKVLRMTSVAAVLECLLKTDHSIDTVQSVLDQLKISKDDLMKMINDERYGDFFQILRPSKNSSQKTTKIALTLDVSEEPLENISFHCSSPCFFSCSVAHITPNNARISHALFCIFVHTIFDLST